MGEKKSTGGQRQLTVVLTVGGELRSPSAGHHQKKQTIRFGFIHGNWALDNSLPHGKSCGLDSEIALLRDLGCYGDFTMPSGASPLKRHGGSTAGYMKNFSPKGEAAQRWPDKWSQRA
jgi:hypothetical protein